MQLAVKNQPGTPQHKIAHRKVDQAIELITEALPYVDTLGEVLSVAESRACGARVRRGDAMDRRLNRVRRG